MKLKIEIDCNNDAFQPAPVWEIVAILAAASRKLENKWTQGEKLQDDLFDCNGNKVGKMSLSK